jgi:predicted phage baseplate assembly protein
MRPEVRLVQLPATAWEWMPALIGDRVASVTARVFTLEDGTYRPVLTVERPGGRFSFSDYATSAGSTIRFGDGELGAAPADGDVFHVEFRLFQGRMANVPADTLVAFAAPAVMPGFVTAITNPLAAEGGRDPESAASIRINAPELFRKKPLRAVQPEDYAEIAERLPWVQKAGAVPRWTGSWTTMFVTPDPRDEVGLSRPHRIELEELMDRVRQAGREVRVNDPRYADLDLQITICVASNAYPGEVKERVLVALFGDTRHVGFFDPDHFTFGTPLSRGALLAALQEVPGVKAVERMRVRRRGAFGWRPFDEFVLRVAANELIRVANDRMLPERGAVTLHMDGGA